MWSKLVLLPRFQQLPDLGLPRFQLDNVIFINVPGTVDAAADLVDVRGGTADGSGQLLLLGVVPVSYTHLDVYKRQGRGHYGRIGSGGAQDL